MKQISKSVLAIAILAAAGSASAAITANNTSANQAYLVVYDPGFVNSDSTLGLTYNRNLGVSFSSILSNPGLLTTDLSTDSNWTTFIAGETNQAKWGVFNSDYSAHSALVTGGSVAPSANSADPTALVGDYAATQINKHAVEINQGLTGVSSLIKSLPDDFTGQADHSADGAPINSVWTGINTAGGFGAVNAWNGVSSTANLYKIGSHFDPTFDLGFQVGVDVTTQADITKLSQLVLTPTALTAVPLPAAVWLFGAGLMGMLRLNRRKQA